MGRISAAGQLDRIAFSITATGVGIAALLLGVHTVPNPNVTWDEAGQYWMTQGQAFGNAWGTPPGSLWEGLDLGRHGNILDPVGFTMLLRAWIDAFGSGPATLRALPFVFFLGTILVSYWMGRSALGLPRTLALLIPSAVLTTYVSLQWATEIRPYSLELFGVVVAAAGTLAYVRAPSWPRIVGLSSALVGILVASRYSFALAAGTAMVVVALVMWRRKKLVSHWRQVAFGFAALAVTALFLVWNLGFLDSGDQVWDNYGDPIRIRSIDDFTNMRILLQVNFLYGWHKLTAAFILLGLIAIILMWKAPQTGGIARLRVALRSQKKDWAVAWLFVVTYEIACAVAAQVGLAQWNSEFRHSIGLIGAAIISGLGLAVLARAILDWFRNGLPANSTPLTGGLKLVGWVALGVSLSWLLITTVATYADFRRTDIETLGFTVPTKVAAAVENEGPVRWIVDTQLWPSLRYIVEASGIPLGTFAIQDARSFGQYGHNDEKLLEWMRQADLCAPGETTVSLVANSDETNSAVYEVLAKEIAAQGCELRSVPLSAVESLVIVK